jgi:hypothetical protein
MTLVNLLSEYVKTAKSEIARAASTALRAADGPGFLAITLYLTAAGAFDELRKPARVESGRPIPRKRGASVFKAPGVRRGPYALYSEIHPCPAAL